MTKCHMNPLKLIKYQLYLFQLENYELGRFLKLLLKTGLWQKSVMRKSLVWTNKAKLIFILAEIIIVFFAALVSKYLYASVLENRAAAALVFLGLFFLAHIFGFVFLILSALILWPADYLIKMMVVKKARAKIKNLRPGLKVIGIAGSYGKTTMKEMLSIVLGENFRVKATPESVNTPVGIARWVLNSVDTSAEIIIVEMGEHYKGDIKELCNLTPPDIAVVTGINEAHLERLGNLENTSATILEIAENLDFNKMLLLNADDAYVFEHKEKMAQYNAQVAFYGYKATALTGFEFDGVRFDQERLGWEYELPVAHLKGFIPLLGEYALGLVVAARQVSGYLKADINLPAALEKLQPVEHRLQPIKSAGNILVIDDAYNGNLDGALEAAGVLSRFANRRKIFITPGLVETGPKTKEVHKLIGRKLAGAADVVILIKNSVTKFIEEGIKDQSSKAETDQPQIIWFDTAVKAHQALPEILKPGDVVVFQNDWGDQYI